MASTNALRCLAARPSSSAATRLLVLRTTSSPFSTTALAYRKVKVAQPQSKQKKNKRSSFDPDVRKPAPGERKNFRKRVQLSNNSALVVTGLDTLKAKTMLDEDAKGKVVGLSDGLVDQLRALEGFKSSQSWGLFRQPHFLVRSETVELMKRMEEGAGEGSKGFRAVLTGSKLSGKSTALLQAQSHALLNGWVAIHIPEGQDLTNGNLDYIPVPETNPLQIAQPAHTQKLLQAILTANRPVLEKMKLQKDWSSLAHLKAGESMVDLLQSAKESDNAWPTLKAVWTELTLPGRPPILFTLDGLSQINKMSEYRDPAFKPIHSHDVTIVGLFIDALSGTAPLPNGGAVLAACTGSNFSRPPSHDLVLSQLEAGQAGKEIPVPEPYERGYDDRVYDALKNCFVQRLEGLPKEEARSLMEYWGASGMLRQVLDSRTVTEKWALAGHGIVGELERVALMSLRM